MWYNMPLRRRIRNGNCKGHTAFQGCRGLYEAFRRPGRDRQVPARRQAFYRRGPDQPHACGGGRRAGRPGAHPRDHRQERADVRDAHRGGGRRAHARGGSRALRGNARGGGPYQAQGLRQPHRDVRAALHVEPLRERLPLLRLPQPASDTSASSPSTANIPPRPPTTSPRRSRPATTVRSRLRRLARPWASAA